MMTLSAADPTAWLKIAPYNTW